MGLSLPFVCLKQQQITYTPPLFKFHFPFELCSSNSLSAQISKYIVVSIIQSDRHHKIGYGVELLFVPCTARSFQMQLSDFFTWCFVNKGDSFSTTSNFLFLFHSYSVPFVRAFPPCDDYITFCASEPPLLLFPLNSVSNLIT